MRTCGNLPTVEVQCGSSHCKFSVNHPQNCVPPSCVSACAQYHTFPEQYTPQINGYCLVCSRSMSRRC
ncbi:hypothetical protein C8J57DRAFT_348000 [Mycena rebaudengoi]|nr:hypothetical protein C8J57DRAFT_348000 [Mycena rebaudengoi]